MPGRLNPLAHRLFVLLVDPPPEVGTHVCQEPLRIRLGSGVRLSQPQPDFCWLTVGDQLFQVNQYQYCRY